MRPITSFVGSVIVTAALLFGLGFLASTIPVMAEDPVESGTVADSKANPATDAAGVLVEITNVRNDKGKVLVAVFEDVEAFEQYDYERARAYIEVAAEAGTVQAHFPRLNAGPYAISLFHDENEDYDFNMDGVYPLEGYGTSGARDSYHEPTFNEASVGPGRVAVRMYYLR